MGLLGGRKPKIKGAVLLKQNGVTMASGDIIHVYDKHTVEVVIEWSSTSVYEKGHSYKVDLKPGAWKVL